MKLLGISTPYKIVIHDYETKGLIVKVVPENLGKQTMEAMKNGEQYIEIDGTLFKSYDVKKCGPVEASDHVLKYIETLKPENQRLCYDRMVTIAKNGLTPFRTEADVNSFLNYYYAESHA